MALYEELAGLAGGGIEPQPQTNLSELLVDRPNPRAARKAAISEFTSDLLYTVSKSLAAGPQKGAGLAAALAGPGERRSLIQQAEDERRKMEMDLSIKDEQLKGVRQARINAERSFVTRDVIQPDGSTMTQYVDKFDPSKVLYEFTSKPAEKKADYTLGNKRFSGDTNEVIAENEPEAKPPDMTPEEKFIDLTLTAAIANNGGNPLTPEQEKEARKTAKSEWSEAGKDGEMADMNLRMRELQVALAEQRLTAAQQSGLSPQQQTQVLRMGSQFDSHAITQKYNKVAEATQYSNSIDPNTKSATDHIALMYAFAKAMDPESVVREGEYSTIKKYSQSWLETFGFDALRVVDNQGFVTPEAIRKIKTTIENRAKPVIQQYQNFRKETIRKMNTVTGRNDGENYLIDYGAAFEAPATGGGGGMESLSDDELFKILGGQ